MTVGMDNDALENEIVELLRELISVAGVTGLEDAVREKITDLLRPTGAHIGTDHMGNLYATVPGKTKGGKPNRVMVCAHMDEVGYVVSNIDDQGFIYLYPLGGIPEYLGPGQWVSLHTGSGIIQGCVGIHPPHLPVTGQKEMFVDVGAQNREEVLQMGISTGTPVTFSRGFHRLNRNRVMGRCIDDRMGCAILIALLRRLSATPIEAEVTGVFSSTEEHGMMPGSDPSNVHGSRGALVAALKLRPDFAVVVDSMVCSDIPGIPRHQRQIRLGQGVALRLVDDLAIMRSPMRKFLEKVAGSAGITIQKGISRSYTDTSVIQLLDVPVATLGIPMRYAHAPAQIADTRDLVQTINFIHAIAQNAGQYLSGHRHNI
ncbi:M42 family metallopeptidase [Desulfallas thermosapovorans]|uniref:Endoglucanase n=1 Tax=Desulfallas thermosapovorans DSM 6562 TaxID=1121431 RepID=A0A5S4ZX39_9FIRM|nr:M42 family metallopeptidase [Desulfallas thermosapovorans]TYO97442.1 endoglucanase [Desulfallas thermosapovorans DSM 6562]